MNNRTLYKNIGKLNNNIPHNNIIIGRNGIPAVIVGSRWNVVVIFGHSKIRRVLCTRTTVVYSGIILKAVLEELA